MLLGNWPTSHHCHKGPKFPWVHVGYYQPVHPQVHTGGLAPVHELTSGENAGKKKVQPLPGTTDVSIHLMNLKHLCTMAPILAYADFKRPFKLHTRHLQFWPGGSPVSDLMMMGPMLS